MEGKTVYFTSRKFNHDIYDSLINSGEIIFVGIELQQYVQNPSQDIKHRNAALLKIREMEESGVDFSLASPLYQTLEETEQDHPANIPDVMSMLEERYPMPAGAKTRRWIDRS